MISSHPHIISILAMAGCILAVVAGATDAEECIEVAPVWSGHPVGFSLLSTPKRQFVGFYDAERKLTVASRWLAQKTWRFVTLPETLGWDSHNYVTMALDDDGRIHLCANMHSSPLVYFRTRIAGDIRTLERVPTMLGRDEARCTYPQFLRGPKGEFLFTYRSGGSGNGDQIYNLYENGSRKWRRLLDSPLTSGDGRMNAYFTGLRHYPDGYYHLAWVWRDTPACETNHDLSYARSRDLVHWERSDGKPFQLPITLETAEIVDPIPPGGGLINGGVTIGFDSNKRLVISYQKFDEKGNNQAYSARLEDGSWKIYRTSDWGHRWYFSGNGSISFEIRVGSVAVEPDGRLSQTYDHAVHGAGKWILDEETLRPIETIVRPSSPQSAAAGTTGDRQLVARSQNDSGASGEAGVRYFLRWEALGPNRDRPREGELPGPSMLKLCRQETAALVVK